MVTDVAPPGSRSVIEAMTKLVVPPAAVASRTSGSIDTSSITDLLAGASLRGPGDQRRKAGLLLRPHGLDNCGDVAGLQQTRVER